MKLVTLRYICYINSEVIGFTVERDVPIKSKHTQVFSIQLQMKFHTLR